MEHACIQKTTFRFIKRQKPKMCTRCWREEAIGIKSAREGFNESYKEHIDEAIASTQEDGSS